MQRKIIAVALMLAVAFIAFAYDIPEADSANEEQIGDGAGTNIELTYVQTMYAPTMYAPIFYIVQSVTANNVEVNISGPESAFITGPFSGNFQFGLDPFDHPQQLVSGIYTFELYNDGGYGTEQPLTSFTFYVYGDELDIPVTTEYGSITGKTTINSRVYHKISVESNTVTINGQSASAEEGGFRGWYNGSSEVSDGDRVPAGMTLLAKYNDSNTLTLDLNYSGQPTPLETRPQAMDVPYNIPENDPERTGYVFDGWYSTSTYDAGTEVTSTTICEEGDPLTLYAKWLQEVAKPVAATGLVYDGTVQTGVPAGTGYTLTGTASTARAGDYTVTAKLNAGYTWSNSTTDDVVLNWSIAPKTVDIEWSSTDSFVYDGASHVRQALLTGIIPGDECTPTITGEQTNAGAGYTATVTGLTGLNNSDYALPASETTSTFSITKRPVTIAVDSKTKTYGGSDPEFTGTVTGLVASEDLGTVSYARIPADVGKENVADTIHIGAIYTANSNYSVTVTQGILKIEKATMHVTPTAVTVTYGTAADSVEYGFELVETDLKNDDTAEAVKAAISGEPAYLVAGAAYAPTLGANQSGYALTMQAGTLTNANYEIVVADTYDVKFVIAKAVLTATYAGETVTYGTDPILDVAVTGFVNNETAATAAGYVAPTLTTDKKNVGDHQLTPSGGEADNYSFEYAAGTLKISKATMHVTPTAVTVTYGTATEAVEYDYALTADDLKNGDTAEAVKEAITGAATYLVAGAVYAPTLGAYQSGYALTMQAGTLTNANYEIMVADEYNIKFVVDPAKLTLTPTSGQTSKYDPENGYVINFELAGAKNGETAAYDGKLAVENNAVGAQKILKNGFALKDEGAFKAANYELDFVENVTYEITPKLLVKPTADQTEFTYTGSGQTYNPVGFDANTMGISGNVQTNASTDGYDVFVTLKDSTNYHWSDNTTGPVAFKFVIAKVNPTFTAPGAKTDLVYDGNEKVLITGGTSLHGSFTYSLNGTAYSEDLPKAIEAGTYTVHWKLTGDANHNDASGTVTDIKIGKGSISFVWTEPSDLTYSGTPKVPTVSITGLASEDTGKVTATIKLSDGKDNVNVGTFTYYVTGLTGESASKYDMPEQVVSSEYTITKKPLSVSITASKTYDGSAFVYTIVQSDLSGLVSGDSLTKGKITTNSAAVGTYDSQDKYQISEALAVKNGIGNYNVSYTVNMVIAEARYVLTYDAGMFTVKIGSSDIYSGTRVAYGTEVTVAALEGYTISSISLDGTPQTSTTGFTMPLKDTFLSVVVQGASHNITYNVSPEGGGSVDQTITSALTGQTVVLAEYIHPNDGYSLQSLTYKLNDAGDDVQISKTGFKMPNGDITIYAVFVQDGSSLYGITVSSMTNGAVSASAYEASQNDTVTLNVNPADGYVLKAGTLKVIMGESEIGLSGSGNTWTFTMPAHDVTVSAEFEKIYTVTVIEPEHGSLSSSPVSGISGTSVELTPAASPGYVLEGVYVNGEAIEADAGKYVFTLDSDVQVSAVFSKLYSLTIDPTITGGTVTSSESGPFKAGTSVTLTITPGEDKDLSQLWVAGSQVSPTASGSGYTYTFQIQSDTSVTAKFSPLYSVTVTDATGGTITSSLSGKAPAGTSVILTVTKSSGYKLDHLIINGEIITISGSTYVFVLQGDTTVTAAYSPGEYKITFNANGGSCSTSTMTTDGNGKLSSLPSASRSGYNFSGWYTSASGGTKVTTTYEFDQDTTVYAHWTAKPVTYRITFDGNGGTPDRAYMTTKTNGRLASLPADPVWEGHRFDGWYKSRVSSVKVTTSTVFSYNTTVYAHWTEYSLGVTYNANGGSGYMAYQNIMYSDASKALKANTFVRDGYVFAGWNTAIDGSGTSYSDRQDVSGLIVDANADLRLYAQWVAKHTVTFAVSDEGYGTVSKQSVVVTDGASIKTVSNNLTVGNEKITATPTADTDQYHYAFVGWTGIPADGKVTSDITVTADFTRTENTYTVTVAVSDDGYGTVDRNSIAVGYGAAVSASDNTLYVGGERITATPAADTDQYSYIFVGWTGIPADGKVTSDLTITADFAREDRRCNVTFTVAEGVTKVVKVIPGKTVTPIADPKLAGVEFKGWFLEGSNVRFNFSTPITEDTVLYAHFGPKAPSTDQTSKITAVMSKDLTAVVTAYDGKIVSKGTMHVSVYQLMTIRDMQVYVEIGSFEESFDCTRPYFISDVSEKTYGIASGPGTYGVMAEIDLDNGTERLSNYTTFSKEGGM